MTTAATPAIALPGPLDLAASLTPVGRSGDDGLDRWNGRLLVRTTTLPDGTIVPYAARPGGSLARPRLLVHLPAEVTAPALALQQIAATLTPDPAAVAALASLSGNDAAVARLAQRYPGVRPVLYGDPLAALVRSISAQQVNLRWASQIRRRLAVTFGRRHQIGGEHVYSLAADALASAGVERLRALQLTRAKASAVMACAEAALAGRLDIAELRALEDEELIARLTSLRGIGRWSAEWFLARTLGRPRVVAGDLGVRKAVGRMYTGAALPSEAQVRQLTGHWGEAASLVQALALHDLAEAPDQRALSAPRTAPPPAN